MMKDKQMASKLGEVLTMLSNEGLKCYVNADEDKMTLSNAAWCYIVTPSDNVMCLTFSEYEGFDFTFKYVPNRNGGSGCQCLTENVYEINKDVVLQAEKEGLKLAKELKAPLYKSSKEWFDYESQQWHSQFKEVK